MRVVKFKLMFGTHICDDPLKGTCPACDKVTDLTAKSCECGWKLPTAQEVRASVVAKKDIDRTWRPIERTYQAGDPKRDIIETTQDLRLLNGNVRVEGSPTVNKFELLVGDAFAAQAPARAKVVDFEEMTLAQLKEFSDEEELGVDFTKVKDAAEGRKAVRAARKQLQPA